MRSVEILEDLEEDKLFFENAMSYRETGYSVPNIVLCRILAGEHPVKVFREFRRLTTHDLARKVGVSRAYIRQVELGKISPPRRALERMAQALRVDISEIE